MSWILAIVAIVAVQRIAELVYARRNTARLRDAGAVEHGARHYPLIVALHAAWLIALIVLVPPQAVPNVSLLLIFVGLQLARIWVIASLGPFWTTRIIVPAGAPAVVTGPYRLMRHPNYVIVCAEIAVLPLAFGAWQLAIAFSVLNAAVLSHRIRVENAARAGAVVTAS